MKKTSLLVLGLAVVCLVFSTMASAQLSDKKTIITINQPMEIPGKPAIVLPPGKYVLKLLNTPGTRSIVQFFNEDETKLYSTVIGIPDYRLQTPEKVEISFYEPEPGRAHPIRAWFYPGDNYGVEFVYSKERALEVARATRQHVMSAANPTTSTPSEQPTSAQVAQLQNESVVAATPQGTEISLTEMNRLFQGWSRGWANGEPDNSTLWAPVVDIVESEDAVILKAELPGVDPNAVDIQLENGVLTLRGERRFEGDREKEQVLRLERPYGTFSRAFSIPAVVDESRISANYDNGILTVTLPKRDQAKPKRIQIAA